MNTKFDRHTVPGQPGSEGYTYYTAADGRFEVSRIYVRGWRWQAKTTDGSNPFVSTSRRYGRRESNVFNADTFRECKEAVHYAITGDDWDYS